MSDFGARLEAFLAEFFALNPLHATLAGDHTHDGRWPDMTAAGRAERLALADRWEAELGAFADGDLSFDEQVDRDLIVMELQAARFAETELRQEAWDPYEWVYLLGGAIFPLVAREFAPLASRLTSVAERLEAMPEVIDAARSELVGHGGRPVSRLHTETALKQLSGVGELADDALREAETAAGTDGDVAALLPRLRAAVSTAHDALAGFEAHLRETVLPTSEGEGRLGPELFARKLRHTLRSDELTPERILERAEREYAAVRAEMVRIAQELWPAWCARTSCAVRRGQARPGGPRRDLQRAHQARTSFSTGAARSWPGSRSSAAVGMSSACPTSRSRSAGRRSSCAPSAARCSTRPGRSTVARRHSSRSRRRRTIGLPSRSSPTCASRTSASCGSSRSTRPCPATTCRVSTPTGPRRWRGRSSGAASMPRAGPST